MNKTEFLQDYKTWVEDVIDSWVQGADDSYEDMRWLRNDLENAEDYFSNNTEDFYEDYATTNYDAQLEEECSSEISEIIVKYVESTKKYVADTYEHWND